VLEKVNVRLVVSERMDCGGSAEGNYIRVPRPGRMKLKTRGRMLKLNVGSKEVALEVKPAFKEDTSKLIGLLDSGDITEEQSDNTVFVTSYVYKQLVGRSAAAGKRSCYLSEDIEDITVGCDPEFALANTYDGHFVYAQHVPGIKNADKSVIGSDGPLAEVRPAPSNNVSTIVERIGMAFHKKTDIIQGYNWVGGATYASPNHPDERIPSMGFHVHIGTPLIVGAENRTAVYAKITRALDEVIALPSVRIDGPDAARRRNIAWKNYGPYGKWGDWREKEHRFEWRVPSGLWLAHPYLARCLLGVSKAVSEHCYLLMAEEGFKSKWVGASLKDRGFLKKWDALDETVGARLLNGSAPREVPNSILDRAAKKLCGLSNYYKYKAEIDAFLEMIYLKDPVFNLDLKSTWLNKGNLLLGGKHRAKR